MTYQRDQLNAARTCIEAALRHIAAGANEDVVRQSFISHVRSFYTEEPAWINYHIGGGEAHVQIPKNAKVGTGFVDNLVSLTAIEYESDISNATKFNVGFLQVRDYCASLIKRGDPVDQVLGILSDTVRWRAYSVAVRPNVASSAITVDDISLVQIDEIDTTPSDENAAIALLTFLERYLDRKGARPLSADSLARDLGFESGHGARHLAGLQGIVEDALQARPEYAHLVADLWARFVHSIHEKGAPNAFVVSEYCDEFYVITLAKLVCANVLLRTGLLSNDGELKAIMNGEFFKTRGLMNLVEFDYFGWLSDEPSIGNVMPIARSMQQDLQAYDFSRALSEDLFGETMAQLARRARRLLLGQEWTPYWLARRMANAVLGAIPVGQRPQLVDMCCGSGTMIVAALHAAKPQIEAQVPPEERTERLSSLIDTITGFDIDPLAVMLAKANWVLAAGDWLEPFGAFPVTIPVFHADSLFAVTPLSGETMGEDEDESYVLKIAGETVLLPRFLVTPSFQPSFDRLLDMGYELASSAGDEPLEIEATAVEGAVRDALTGALPELGDELVVRAGEFLCSFARTVDKLTRLNLNGIWAFILRNSYRPGLVVGKFNGLISNPPWLALSKIAANPYKDVLETKAENFDIAPAGPAFLHTELATVFLLHAVHRYLKQDAAIACIVPDTVTNGYHHNPFRQSRFLVADVAVDFDLRELWKVDERTFKNKAVVLIGKRGGHKPGLPNPIPGMFVAPKEDHVTSFHRISQGNRTAWSEQAPVAGSTGFFQCAQFDQGADVMPRTVFFHEFQKVPNQPAGHQGWQVKPIDPAVSAIGFAVRDAKECKGFQIAQCVVPDDVVFQVLISNLLTPFQVAEPLRALLPITHGPGGVWRALSEVEAVTKGAGVIQAFRHMGSALTAGANIGVLWDHLNTRNKLVRQRIPATGFLVLSGTSGEHVCAAYLAAASVDTTKLVVDQTLNHATVATEDEAIYLVGLLNSNAVDEVIGDFQPQGAFGRRHIHSLPYRATPPYDATQALHQAVVTATRALIAEYNSLLATNGKLLAILDPNASTLASRRKRLSDAMSQLPSFSAYETAARALYGLP